MPNVSYFDIPADNVERAKIFYKSLLGRKIEPTKVPQDPKKKAQSGYMDIITGKEEPGAMNMGGLYKRQMGEPIKIFVTIDDIDNVLAKVGKLGGKIIMQKEMMKGVGLVSMIQDSEGNTLGVWKPMME
jgi:uncharacterized protein